MNKTLGVDTFKRYLTLKTHKIYALPVAILMPHSGCNCRCVMCDIWKGNHNVQQLTEAEVRTLLDSLKRLGTQWVVLSGGEALMHPHFFQLTRLLRAAGMRITLLSTGLLLKRYASQLVEQTDEIIVSLDGSEKVHNAIRRIPNAYGRLAAGVKAVKGLKPDFPLSARCVIQRLNFADWPNIVDAAHQLGLDRISFLAADVSTEAFNRPGLWPEEREAEVKLAADQLPQLKAVIEALIRDYASDFEQGYIVESPDKIRRIYDYYAAFYGLADFPPVRCNAPWVSTVIEADGTVRPCFFQPAMGNIRQTPLIELLNRPAAIAFRQNLDLETNPICRKCVCSLNLRPLARVKG